MSKWVVVFLLLLVLVGTVSATTVYLNSSHDGYLKEGSALSWVNLRNAVGDTATDNGSGGVLWIDTVAQPAPDTNVWAPHNKAIITFDTSTLPDDATISSATVSVRGLSSGAWNGAGTINMSLLEAHPANPMDYVAADYAKTNFIRMAATDIPYASYNEGGYNVFTLTNLTTINKTGYTSFIVTHDKDADASALTWGDGVESYFELQARSAAADAQVIAVTYTTPATVADFGTNVTLGNSPLGVQFADISSSTPTNWDWYWYANETKSSDLQNPTAALTTGVYNVRLYANNAAGGSWENKTAHITVVSGKPVSHFYTDAPTAALYGIDAYTGSDPIGGGTGFSTIYTTGNYIATSKAELLANLSSATSGQRIYIPETANIDMTGEGGVFIPNGVTLASNRGSGGSLGGRINYTRSTGTESNYTKWSVFQAGNNVTITGLRIEGSDYTNASITGSPKTAITLTDGLGLEVSNCEISNWSEAAVNIYLLNNATILGAIGLNSANIGKDLAYIHHNYIHNTWTSGRGYGVELSGGSAYVTANIFDYTRHAIAGGGQPTEGYEVTYNHHLGNTSGLQVFDMHAYPAVDPPAVTATAGHTIKISYNTFDPQLGYDNWVPSPAFELRAAPVNGVWIDHNRFRWYGSQLYSPITRRYSGSKLHVTDNLIGSAQTLYITTPDFWDTPASLSNFTVSSGTGTYNVSFTDATTWTWGNNQLGLGGKPNTYTWDFGDTGSSSSASPYHTYSAPGRYAVILSVVNTTGGGIPAPKSAIVWSNGVFIKENPSTTTDAYAGYVPNSKGGTLSLLVNFTDISFNTPTGWSYLFQDVKGNNTLIEFAATKNASYTFDPGNFSIFLNSSNAYGYNVSPAGIFVNVSGVPPVTAFTCTPLSGTYPLSVTCTDASTNTPTSWAWYNNTTVVSTSQSPTFSIHTRGLHDIKLLATNGAGGDWENKSGYITTENAVTAAFSCTPVSGAAPLSPVCTDASTNTPTNWDWYWGTDETKGSDSQNPTLTNLATGTYNVRLYSSNAVGGDWENKSTYITSGTAPTAVFSGTPLTGTAPLSTQFTDASTGIPTAWAWYWYANETVSSASQNPLTGSLVTGTYNVRLYTSNVLGGDWENKSTYITSGAVPVTNFTCTPLTGAISQSVVCTDTSTNVPNVWAWYNNSTALGTTNPITFTLGVGLHDIKLYSSNVLGGDWENKTGYVNISNAVTPVASFTKSRAIVKVPQVITFTDTSTNTPTSWAWTFGDGSTSTSQNPTHAYARAGLFTITLIATNAAGSNTITSSVWVQSPYYQLIPDSAQEFMYSCQEMTYGLSLELNNIDKILTDGRILKLCEEWL